MLVTECTDRNDGDNDETTEKHDRSADGPWNEKERKKKGRRDGRKTMPCCPQCSTLKLPSRGL